MGAATLGIISPLGRCFTGKLSVSVAFLFFVPFLSVLVFPTLPPGLALVFPAHPFGVCLCVVSGDAGVLFLPLGRPCCSQEVVVLPEQDATQAPEWTEQDTTKKLSHVSLSIRRWIS